jgi:DNA-directed RNA polymerase specialized sigma24 family protein
MGGYGHAGVDVPGVPRSQLEKDAEEYPSLYPFGTDLVDFLDQEEEPRAPFEQRLRSVWRYIVGRVKRFAATLKPREAAILDCEDIVNTVAAQLLEKDGLWDPGRGKYSTFAEQIVRNVLSTCHEQARAVSGPANSHGRLQGYYQRRGEGTLTRGMWCTMTSIERVMEDFASYEEDSETPPFDSIDVQALLTALRNLDGPIQVWALVHKYGLLDTEPMSFKQIAQTLDLKHHQVKILIKSAREILKRSLNHEA